MKNLIILMAVACTVSLSAQKGLPKFGADMGKKSVMGQDVRVPYTSMVSYYGYVKPGTAPDATVNGKKMYYLYLWVPVAAPEIGIRMISPIPADMKAATTDFASDVYTANSTERTTYFDTWIALEKADGILKAEDIASKASSAKWNTFDQNDDSSEMPKQPSGSAYNSLMRVTSEVSNPLKALTIGLYRIAFTTYKTGEVQGSFLAQVGAPVDIPGVVIAPTVDAVAKLATTKK
jgi:hypothetical protein